MSSLAISEATRQRQAAVLRAQSAAVARAAAGLDGGGSDDDNDDNEGNGGRAGGRAGGRSGGAGGGGGGGGSSSSSSAAACVVCGDARPATSCCFPCGHGANVCGMCAARVRLLSGDRKCPLCKAALEHIVVLARAELEARGGAPAFEDFGIYGAHGGPDLTLDEPSGMFYHASADGMRREVVRLRSFRCGCAASAAPAAAAAAAATPAQQGRGGGGGGGGAHACARMHALRDARACANPARSRAPAWGERMRAAAAGAPPARRGWAE